MNEQEIIAWREKIRSKSFHFWIRDEIEEIIREENIDRTRFHEFSKLNYEDIIRKFYFSFSERKNYTPSVISLSYNHIVLIAFSELPTG